MKAKEFFRETLRLALLGALASYAYLAYHLAGNLAVRGGLPSWGAALRYVPAALFLFPLVGLLFALIGGALSSLVTRLTGVGEEKRRRIGALVVAVVIFVYLGSHIGSLELLVSPLSILGYVVSLLLGAGFVWFAWRCEALASRLSRIAGLTLAGAAVLWLAFTFLFPRFFPRRSPSPPPDPVRTSSSYSPTPTAPT